MDAETLFRIFCTINIISRADFTIDDLREAMRKFKLKLSKFLLKFLNTTPCIQTSFLQDSFILFGRVGFIENMKFLLTNQYKYWAICTSENKPMVVIGNNDVNVVKQGLAKLSCDNVCKNF